MYSRVLTSTMALAGAVSALMVPPSIPPAAMPNDPLIPSALPGPALEGQPKATIELACPHCPLAVGQIHGHPVKWADGPDTRLLIELTSDGSQLYFNGAPIYPLAPSSHGRHLTAKQVYMDESDPNATEQLYSRGLPLSTGIEVHPKVEMISFHLDASNIKDIVERIPMRQLSIEIMGLGEKLIKVDTIRVKFSDDKLQIHDVAIIPYGSEDSEAEQACDTVLCRLRTDLQAKLSALRQKMDSSDQPSAPKPKKPCGNKPANTNAYHPEADADIDEPSQPAGMPLHMPAVKGGLRKFGGKFTADGKFRGFASKHMDAGGWRGHHHHQPTGMHGAFHTVVSFIYHIIVPVMVGIAAGMLVSGVGMLVGQAVVWVCMRLFGARRQGYESLEVVFIDDADDVEYLPKYEEVYDPEPGTPPPAFDEKEILQ